MFLKFNTPKKEEPKVEEQKETVLDFNKFLREVIKTQNPGEAVRVSKKTHKVCNQKGAFGKQRD